MKLTTRIKLHTDSDTHQSLVDTMRVFNRVCNFVSEYAFAHRVFHKRNLQHALYDEVKARFGLPSQLIVRAFAKVGESYKTQRSLLVKRVQKYEALSPQKRAKRKKPELRCCTFRDKGSVVYDSRLLTYRHDNTISIRTWNQRITLSCSYVPDLNKATLKGEADLVLEDNVFYLLQTLELEAPELTEVTDYLGVDLGMVHLATDSEGEHYDSPNIEARRAQYETQRSVLKKCKTKNARRRLKRMGKRLSRFRKDVNHRISKALVQKAKALGQGLAMEALVDFFDKTKVRRKNRAERHSWAFFQLRCFVAYKAEREGLPLVLVEAAYTSQECPVCHQIDRKNRTSQSGFLCRNPRCQHSGNADGIAAKNVRNRARVNLPEVPRRWDDVPMPSNREAATIDGFGHSIGREGQVLPVSAASHTLCGDGS